MDGGVSWATLHGVEKNRTRLSNFTFSFTAMIKMVKTVRIKFGKILEPNLKKT